ncbi:hypothetical protein CXP39_01835 [Mesoplasma syrphidae]|uniref:Lipoprotein n=1 Tax=Mesoplasma syrphidae TaxID=225999 RepID=A0A2K9BJT3_9MOLU|nr:hypothetical protein [Mesoplasma syrphidae]AUF83531.1 hypothetical protein CXP39_01835 [Mesoplasma syrphidae]
MKKILTIMSAFGIATTLSTTVVGCGPKKNVLPEIEFEEINLNAIDFFKERKELGEQIDSEAAVTKVRQLILEWQSLPENSDMRIKMIDSVDIKVDEDKKEVKISAKPNQLQYTNFCIFTYTLKASF